ncbi:MAG: hypothetical protein R3F50_10760 [Gammaproteobacteria bacterium]
MPILESVISEANSNSYQTIIFSIEGLTAHIDSIKGNSLIHFEKLIRGWDLSILIVIRERKDWSLSMYKQCIVNPKLVSSDSAIELLYSTGVKFEYFYNLETVRNLCDPVTIKIKLKKMFPMATLLFVDYQESCLDDLIKLTGLAGKVKIQDAKRVNLSLPSAEIELIRRVNSLYEDPSKLLLFKAIYSRTGNHSHVQLSQYSENITVSLRNRFFSFIMALRILLMINQENRPLTVSKSTFNNLKFRAVKALLEFAFTGKAGNCSEASS